MQKKTLVGLMAAVLAAALQAYTVYDAGKALRANCASGTPTGASGDTYYTDENGGKWQFRLSSEQGTFANVTFPSGTYTGYNGKLFAGFALDNTKQSSSVRVNMTDAACAVQNGTVEPNELVMFPANNTAQCAHVRFIAPEAGWYSAFVSAHDLSRESAAASANSGAKVVVRAQGNLLVYQVVSLEEYPGTTHRFDFQMPVRYLAAGDAVDVIVGGNGSINNDNTGVKFFVTKEDEGRFYDSGIAMTNNLATVYTNVYGTIKDGTWYYLLPEFNVATGAAFEAWAPLKFSKYLTLLTNRCTRAAANNQRGFANDPDGYAPYLIVNETAAVQASVAPQELHAHPMARKPPTLRFRPPESGYYSASVVARDVTRSTVDVNGDGVWVCLNVADHVVDSAYVSLETNAFHSTAFQSTAHLTFNARLVAAGEPIDVVIFPCANQSSDATAFSVIIRREEDVYDAGKSFYAHHVAGNHTHPFPDALNDGATWDLGAKTNAWCRTQFWSLPAYKTLQGTSLGWWVHSASGDQENGNLPRIAMATNGVASGDSYYVGPGLVGTFPYEFFVHPNSANVQSSSPTLRAVVPADGIYHARGYARDLSQFDINGGGDGIRLGIAVNGLVPDLVVVSRDSLNRASACYESAADGDRLWLKAGDTLDFVVDPNSVFNGDGTGLTACYAKEGDVAAETRVVNVHFTESGSGKLSATTQRPREGWSNWNNWNALRPGTTASASVKNCVEADGTTPRNVIVTLTRDSGDAIAKETPNGSVFLSHVSSSDVDDSYTFTVGNLKKNEPYALYLYGVKNSSTGGNATFTVGGVTKALDEVCIYDGNAKTLARFDVTSDANGTITGTFAATDANGGAFNGLTLVGELPAYIAAGATIIVR